MFSAAVRWTTGRWADLVPSTGPGGEDPVRLTRTCAAAAALLTLAGAVASCSSSKSGGSTGGAAGKPLVGVDYPRSDTDFWNSYIRYVPQFAGQLGVELKTTN